MAARWITPGMTKKYSQYYYNHIIVSIAKEKVISTKMPVYKEINNDFGQSHILLLENRKAGYHDTLPSY
jgi:hypothetical protein